jgi:hypothetical protein
VPPPRVTLHESHISIRARESNRSLGIVDNIPLCRYEPHYALIATYTAELDARAQVERYTAFLRRFVDTDKRRKVGYDAAPICISFWTVHSLSTPAPCRAVLGARGSRWTRFTCHHERVGREGMA